MADRDPLAERLYNLRELLELAAHHLTGAERHHVSGAKASAVQSLHYLATVLAVARETADVRALKT